MVVQAVKVKPSSPPPPVEARQAVKELLLRSEAFSKLPAETQQRIAQDTAEIAGYLVRPEGIPGNKLPTAAALPPLFQTGSLSGTWAATGHLASTPTMSPALTGSCSLPTGRLWRLYPGRGR